MNTARDYLAQIAHSAQAQYPGTRLATSHAHVTRRVRQHRTTRAAATAVAGVSVVGAGSWGALLAFGPSTDVQLPGATSTSASPSPAPSPSPPPAAPPAKLMLTVVEGKTIEWVADKLSSAYGVTHAEASSALTASVEKLIPEASTAEGWPMPGDFDLPGAATVDEAADLLVNARIEELNGLGVPRDQWQNVLTKASLVEREAKLDQDRAKIARAIDNRLAQGLMLQLDSTVRYAAPGEGVFVSAEDKDVDSPYNTYRYEGLPPGAISSPSDASIQAVLNPAVGDWLYFVTVNLNTGETLYASTYDQHLANVMKLRDWVQANE